MTTKEMLTSVINGKRAEQSAENRSANLAIAEVIKSKMKKNVTYAASEIVTLIAAEYPDIKTAKITPVMAVGIDEGMFTKVDDYKVGGKGRKVNGYTAVVTEDAKDTES